MLLIFIIFSNDLQMNEKVLILKSIHYITNKLFCYGNRNC